VLEFARSAQEKPAALATRSSSQKTLDVLGAAIPEMLGGSADLTGSNNTNHRGSQAVTAEGLGGNYLHYGVREFGMTAIMNGVALHGGFVPYGGTFLVFSDYARNAVRMACLMKQRVILVYTHDSIGLGEDGPTHQPVEHVASLRVIPNMQVWRPCDTVETALAWASAVERTDGPTSLVLSRQALPPMERTPAQVGEVARGGYVLVDCGGRPDCVLIATGSEVGLAVDAARRLTEAGRRIRVVSMPCTAIFDVQPQQYRDSVLPRACRASPSRPARATAGGATSAATAPSSAWTASAPRHRRRSCSSISVSRRTMSSGPWKDSCSPSEFPLETHS